MLGTRNANSFNLVSRLSSSCKGESGTGFLGSAKSANSESCNLWTFYQWSEDHCEQCKFMHIPRFSRSYNQCVFHRAVDAMKDVGYELIKRTSVTVNITVTVSVCIQD